MANGMTEKDARAKAFKDNMWNIVKSAETGAVQGLVMGSIGLGVEAAKVGVGKIAEKVTGKTGTLLDKVADGVHDRLTGVEAKAEPKSEMPENTPADAMQGEKFNGNKPLEIPKNSDTIGNTELNHQGFRDEAYNAYLKMMDEVYSARESNMNARDFAKKNGVPSSLSDEQAKVLDDLDFKMYSEDKGKTTFKFSDMTPDEAMKIAQEYRTKAPIEIPKEAKATPKSMNAGYEQITYNWRTEGYKYEVRWHTRTPGAPENQGNTWVVKREIPGNGGQKARSFYKIGNTGTDADWVKGMDWFDAIRARDSGTAIQKQIEILDMGHWKE